MKEIIRRCFVITFVITFVCIFAVAVAYAAAPDTVVFVTKTGSKYHREDCSTLRSSKIETTLGKAVAEGYEPCELCRPPVLDGEE